MVELKPKRKTGRKRLLENALILTLIFSGQLLDISESFINLIFPEVIAQPTDSFLQLQDMCREFIVLGLSIAWFRYVPYEELKTKTLSFMFSLWAIITILHNNFFDLSPNTLSSFLYCCYLWWLFRIAIIKKPEKEINGRLKKYEKYGIAYNILMPVNTFRGLLQILFLPHKCPLYETRLLIAGDTITGIIDKEFTQIEYTLEQVKSFMVKGGKIRLCKKYNKEKVDRLIGKKMILMFRDCKRLEL